MGRIVITEFMDERAVAQLSAKHDVLYDATLVDAQPKLLAAAADADTIIVRNRTQVRGELLASLVKCKVVGRLGVGLDNIDVEACEARGIEVIPASGANALSVAEYVIAASMILLRGAYASSTDVATGRWPRNALSGGREIGGMTMGVVGFGSIGQITARLARGMGMEVIAFDAMLDKTDSVFVRSGVRPVDFDGLLAMADVVSLHVPLVDATRNLFDENRIDTMKYGALLINTSRGGIVDECALAIALRSGRLGGAALDVFEEEPLKAGGVFVGCPNVVLTPHIAGVTRESNERVSMLIASKVLEALSRWPV